MSFIFSEDTKKWAIQNVLRVLVAYNRTCIQIKINYRNARRQHRTFDILCTFFDNMIATAITWFVYLTCDKIEPTEPSWVSFCHYISEDNGLNSITNDKYIHFQQNEWVNDPAVVLDPSGQYYSILKKSYLDAKTTTNYYNSRQVNNSILIAKICPAASIIRLAKNVDAEKDLTDLKTSSARFLEIEYKCGNQSPITIEVPKSHYFARNELLSKAYVLRYLEHLPNYSSWEFNESDYSLRIVDEDSEVFSLNSSQYILLERDGYRVVDSIYDREENQKDQKEEEETKEHLVEN